MSVITEIIKPHIWRKQLHLLCLYQLTFTRQQIISLFYVAYKVIEVYLIINDPLFKDT